MRSSFKKRIYFLKNLLSISKIAKLGKRKGNASAFAMQNFRQFPTVPLLWTVSLLWIKEAEKFRIMGHILDNKIEPFIIHLSENYDIDDN